jgi:hypothetical protein
MFVRSLVIVNNVGYFNAAKFCQDAGKEIRNFSDTNSNKELIDNV